VDHHRKPMTLKWMTGMEDGVFCEKRCAPLDWIASNGIVERSQLRSLVTTMRSKCEKHSCLERPKTDVIPCVVA
jgi:hypothetical protein